MMQAFLQTSEVQLSYSNSFPMKDQTNKNTPDLLLWQRIIAGDKMALGELFDKYYLTLLNFGLRFSDDREAVKDAIQDLFIRIFGNKKISPDVSVRSYLLRALRNTLLNSLSKRKNAVDIDSVSFSLPEDENLFERLFPRDDEEQRMARRLIDAISHLNRNRRQVLWLRYVNGLSHQEIADIMEMNVQSSKNLLNRTIHKLRAMVGKDDDILLPAVIALLHYAM